MRFTVTAVALAAVLVAAGPAQAQEALLAGAFASDRRLGRLLLGAGTVAGVAVLVLAVLALPIGGGIESGGGFDK